MLSAKLSFAKTAPEEHLLLYTEVSARRWPFWSYQPMEGGGSPLARQVREAGPSEEEGGTVKERGEDVLRMAGKVGTMVKTVGGAVRRGGQRYTS